MDISGHAGQQDPASATTISGGTAYDPSIASQTTCSVPVFPDVGTGPDVGEGDLGDPHLFAVAQGQREQSNKRLADWISQLRLFTCQLEDMHREQIDEHQQLVVQAASSRPAPESPRPETAPAACGNRFQPLHAVTDVPVKHKIDFCDAVVPVSHPSAAAGPTVRTEQTPEKAPLSAWPAVSDKTFGGLFSQPTRNQILQFTEDFRLRRLRDMGWRIESLVRLTTSTQYQVFCSAIILLNALFVGVRAQLSFEGALAHYEGNHHDEHSLEHTGFTIDVLFCAWFTLELILNLIADPRDFGKGDNWKWNLFDTLLVLNCLGESAVQGIIPDVGDYVRTLRVFRAARILRVVRVFRVFTSLRLMVYAIMQSMVSLVWVFMLLTLLMYVFAIFFINAAGEYMRQPSIETGIADSLRLHYSTIPRCLSGLFMAVSGGMDWNDLVVPLEAINWWFRYVYLLYIFFTAFGVLNVVTGAFVDSYSLVSQRDRDMVIADELKREKKYVKEIELIFAGADADDSGRLTFEEFEMHLRNSRVKAFLHSLQLDASKAQSLFTLLDVDGTNEVSVGEFVTGCMRLKGDAKSVDVNMLLYKHDYMMSRFSVSLERIEQNLGISDVSLTQACNNFHLFGPDALDFGVLG